MAKMPTGFRLVDDVDAFVDKKALVVRVPAGIADKSRLLKLLAKELKFPSYFGHNWDALDECLRDLSWLDGTKRIVLLHADIPFGERGSNRSIYLDTLMSAASWWKKRTEHELLAVFPSRYAGAFEKSSDAAKM